MDLELELCNKVMEVDGCLTYTQFHGYQNCRSQSGWLGHGLTTSG